jgi:hypothetical protein
MTDVGARLMQYHAEPVPSMGAVDHVESVQSEQENMRQTE